VVHSQSTASTLITQFEPNGTLAERIALTDARVRQHVSYAIAAAFLLANFLTLAGVAFILETDCALARAGSPPLLSSAQPPLPDTDGYNDQDAPAPNRTVTYARYETQRVVKADVSL
jgi:hypothetical protein